IRGEVACRSTGRPTRLGGLQRWFDNSRHGSGDLILQIEDGLEQTVEAIGPEVRTRLGLNQLRSDAHPAPAFSDRAFEPIAHAKFAPDPRHVDRSIFIRKA